MAKITLTDAGLRSLHLPDRGQISYWDARLPSFGVRVSQGGSKTFVLNHKNTIITIGRYPILSLSEARTEAKRLLAEFTLGRVRPQVQRGVGDIEAPRPCEAELAGSVGEARAPRADVGRWDPGE